MRVAVHVGKTVGSILTFISFPAILAAQSGALQMGMLYQCPGNNTFKVVSCAGTGPADQCDVQTSMNGQPAQSSKTPRQQVVTLAALCQPQAAGSAGVAQRGASPNTQTASAQAGVGGFKVGDTVQINTAFGRANAKVLRIDGSNYYVHAETGADVWKTYPNELRRVGPINAEDRTHGLYALHDRVQVNVEGKWLDGEIITELGMDYQVQLPGNRTAWASGQNLRLLTAADKVPSQAPKAGTAPKPGLTSCAGKIDGRYSSSAAGLGGLSITFRSGNATMSGGLGADEEFECWTGGGKIILHKPGESNATDMPIDINNDGTLDTPLGEIRKKGN
jgi:hypothetical protein